MRSHVVIRRGPRRPLRRRWADVSSARHFGGSRDPFFFFFFFREPTPVPVCVVRPPGGRVTFFCLSKRKSPKKRTPSRPRSQGHPCPCDYASRLRGLLRAHPCALRKRARIHARARAARG